MSFRIYSELGDTSSHAVYTQPYTEPSPNPNQNVSNPSSSFQDVHIYDYTYKEIDYQPVITDPEEKLKWIKDLQTIIKNPLATQGVQLILSNVGMPGNLDTTNQKKAEDLLADLSHIIITTKNNDLLELVEEQMADMFQLGQCAQGRVTRLWQLISIFKA